MSGAGRKSAYRKSVTEEVLNSFPEPDVAAGERVAQVVQSRGGNILQVLVADEEDDGPDSSSLAILPTKFRKLIWVKRGDFLIVSGTSHDFLTAAGEKGKVKFMVEHILYKEQVKHLKEVGLWPADFADAAVVEGLREGGKDKGEKEKRQDGRGEARSSATAASATVGDVVAGSAAGEDGEEEDEDSEYESEEDYSDLHVNTNRLAKAHLYVDGDEDEDDDDNEEDEDEDEGEALET